MTNLRTSIEWTDATWNVVSGCTKVSAGCDNCYAERITNRFGGPGAFDKVILHPDRLEAPLHWRKPRLVFVNSMSDLFHDDVPDGFIAQVFAVMATAEQHTFQVLTKRQGRMHSLLTSDAFWRRVKKMLWVDPHFTNRASWSLLVNNSGRRLEDYLDLDWTPGRWPLPNVRLGVSVENQKWADIRIPKLLETPAAVRFLSCEPLLGPIDLGDWLGGKYGHSDRRSVERDSKRTTPAVRSIQPGARSESQRSGLGVSDPDASDGPSRSMDGSGTGPPPRAVRGDWSIGGSGSRIDWVIVGGESGPGARPMHPEWARSLRDQCAAAGVPYFAKQGSGLRSGRQYGLPDDIWAFKEMQQHG